MKKYFALSFLLLLSSFSYYLASDLLHELNVNAVEVSNTLDQDRLDSTFPKDDNGKDNVLTGLTVNPHFLVILSIISLYFFAKKFTRIHVLLTPVFYQSNYVISSPE